MTYGLITDANGAARAFESFREGFARQAKVFPGHTVGFQGGSKRCDVYWHDDLKVWGLFEPVLVKGRFWTCFGAQNPTKHSNLSITVEINPPTSGVNLHCAGAFLRDDEGRVYLGHSGKVGGGRKGIGKAAFREFASSREWTPVRVSGGRRMEVTILGEVGSRDLTESIKFFVDEVAKFKRLYAGGAGRPAQYDSSKMPTEDAERSSFTGLIRRILESSPEGMTPQQIRDVVKAQYPSFYATESHIRNVEKGHYKDLDHALLAQIYSTSRLSQNFCIDRTRKPIQLRLADSHTGADFSEPKPASLAVGGGSRAVRPVSNTVRVVTPSPALIATYLRKWEKLENYTLQESSLALLFHDLCPRNDEIEHILLKVSALNDFYSTHIYDTYSVARHILSQTIDSRLERSDYQLVNDIAVVLIKGKTKNLYSFASKYCSHHKPADYPIFDSFVEKMLLHYRKVDNFEKFNREDLRDYKRFIEIIRAFQNVYDLEGLSLRAIDIFLWLAGKEYFPPKYN